MLFRQGSGSLNLCAVSFVGTSQKETQTLSGSCVVDGTTLFKTTGHGSTEKPYDPTMQGLSKQVNGHVYTYIYI